MDEFQMILYIIIATKRYTYRIEDGVLTPVAAQVCRQEGDERRRVNGSGLDDDNYDWRQVSSTGEGIHPALSGPNTRCD